MVTLCLCSPSNFVRNDRVRGMHWARDRCIGRRTRETSVLIAAPDERIEQLHDMPAGLKRPIVIICPDGTELIEIA